jgi:heme-degrading monooxygenase HmoA
VVVDVTTFRLAAGMDEDEFLAVDRRWQTELVPNRDGFVRRTTARRAGEWAVITLWATEADAAAFAAETAGHKVRRAFEAALDTQSVRTARFDTLD